MSIMAEQALQLYNLCDLEQKGYITKEDMHRLQEYLPLTLDQLESVFDSLDDDGNGCLTISEFTDGFGAFLTGSVTIDEDEPPDNTEDFDAEYEEEQFKQAVKELNVSEAFEEALSLESIKEQWMRLRKTNPDLVPGFEALLASVCNEIRRSKSEYKNLESALRVKSCAQEEEVRKLYEEMENQLKTSRERVIQEERAREKKIKEDLEKEIRQRDMQYHEMMRKQDQMTMVLEEMNMRHGDTIQERERLEKEREELSKKLKEMKANLSEAQSYINELNKKARADKRKRAKAAIALNESIVLERESLVRQLDSLKKDNEELMKTKAASQSQREDGDGCRNNGETIKMGKFEDDEEMPSTFGQGSHHCQSHSNSLQVPMATHGLFGAHDPHGLDDDVEIDELPPELTASMSNMIPVMSPASKGMLMGRPDDSESESESEEVQDIIEEEEVIEEVYEPEPPPPETISTAIETDPEEPTKPPVLNEVEIQTEKEEEPPVSEAVIDPVSTKEVNAGRSEQEKRMEPDGASETPAPEVQPFRGLNSPQRIFKVVFVGDSGVGKSSVLYRFCENNFKSTFSATIGVDFQIKSLLVDDHYIALQLWDTAGQERFRSITKQYYRKADAVIIVYDATNEQSFTNVHSWIQNVRDGTEENTVLMLLGNKADLARESGYAVNLEEGRNLAKEYEADFYEVSAKTGENVHEAFEELAGKLKANEDKGLCESIKVTENDPKKKGCCG